MNTSNPMFRGYAVALLAIFFWSFNVIIASSLKNEILPAELTFWRWTVAGLVLLPFILKNAWQSRQIIYKNKLLLCVLGVLGVAIMNSLIYESAHTASVIDIALLGTLGPIFLAIILSVVFKKKLTQFQTIGMFISFMGVVIIICHGNLKRLEEFNFVVGDIYVIIRNIIFAVYTILLSRKPKDLQPSVFLGCTIFFGLLSLFGYLAWTHEIRFISNFSPKAIALIVYMGIFPSLISFLCWNEAIMQLGTIRTSLIYYLIPLLSVIEAYFILGEVIVVNQIAGGLVVVAGIFLATMHSKHSYPVSNIHH